MRHHFAFFPAFAFTLCSFQNATAQPPTLVSQQPPPRVGTPEKLLVDDVKAFVAALNGEDPVLDAGKYVWKAHIGFYGATEWQRWWLETRGTHWLAISDVRVVKIEGTEAEITLSHRRDAKQAQATIEGPFTLKFGPSPLDKSIGGPIAIWQFVPQRPTAAESLSVAPLRWAIWMVAQSPNANATKSFREAELASQPEKRASNREAELASQPEKRASNRLKQVARAVFRFVNDFEEIYAFLPEFQEEALDPYLENSEAWNVPGTTEKFLFNGRLSGKREAQVAEKERTILFYDGADEKPIYRFDGKTAVALADGHVEMADAQQFKTFLWQ